MEISIKELENKLQNVLYTTDEERNSLLDTLRFSGYAGREIIIEIRKNHVSEEWSVNIELSSVVTLIGFKISPYPGCCAMMIFHNFRYRIGMPEDKVHGIVSLCLRYICQDSTWWNSRRLVVMMAEVRPAFSDRDENHHRTSTITKRPKKYAATHVVYPHFFRFFHKQLKTKTTFMWNKNTGNVVHCMEVLFDPILYPTNY